MVGGVGRYGRLFSWIVGKVHPLGRLGVTPGGARGAVPGLAAGCRGGFRCSPTRRTTGGFGFVLVVVVMVPMAFLLLAGAGMLVDAARQLVSHRLALEGCLFTLLTAVACMYGMRCCSADRNSYRYDLS